MGRHHSVDDAADHRLHTADLEDSATPRKAKDTVRDGTFGSTSTLLNDGIWGQRHLSVPQGWNGGDDATGTSRPSHVIEWPPLSWQRWRRLLEFDDGHEWLRVEEFYDGDTLVVRAELPDIDPDKEVEVTTTDGVVRIHAHREPKSDHKEKRGHRSEFRYVEFERDIALPQGAVADDVKAAYNNGVLEVRIPSRRRRSRPPPRCLLPGPEHQTPLSGPT